MYDSIIIIQLIINHYLCIKLETIYKNGNQKYRRSKK